MRRRLVQWALGTVEMRRFPLLIVGLSGLSFAGLLSAQTLAAQRPAQYECWEQNPARHVKAAAGVTLCSGRPPGTGTAPDGGDTQTGGALIVSLESGGIAERDGLRAGDLIYKVDGALVTDARSAAAGLGDIQDARDTLVNFLRGGKPYLVRLRKR